MKENIYELMPRRAYISKITEFVCGKESPTQQFCLSSIFSIVGEDFSELNTVINFGFSVSYTRECVIYITRQESALYVSLMSLVK